MTKNCNDVKSYMRKFFYDSIDEDIKRELIEHLQHCKKCLKEFQIFANSIGLEFDLIREIIRLDLEISDTEKSSPDKWEVCAKLNDYNELMKVYAVQEIMLSSDNDATDEEYSDKIRLFGNFLIKKICQKVDFLEQCLLKEYDTKGGLR